MRNRIPYRNFSSYVLRSPLLSFDFYKVLTSKRHISDKQFKDFCLDKRFKEAIYLASPALSKAIDRWINDEIDNEKDIDKLKYSILKYISRMCSRCTPFGLFAGCAIGNFSDETNIDLNSLEVYKRHTRLDMNYLVALSQDLTKIDYLREQLLFFPNTSIYKVGEQLRYIEYKYIKGKRYHYIISVDHTSYLNRVLELAKTGAKLQDLAQALVNDDISEEDAIAYVEQLVASQLLVSEFEPSVSGPEFLDQIITVLKKLNNVEPIIKKFELIKLKLNELDKKIGNDLEQYQELITLLEGFKTEINPKFMFQTDMSITPKHISLDKAVIKDILDGLQLLNKISIKKRSGLLTKFKDAFYERFEENEIPLSQALDTEIGIGYRQNKGHGDINPLVDSLVLEAKKNSLNVRDIKWSAIHDVLQKKLIDAYKNNSYSLSVSKNDFEAMEDHWNDLPDTFSCMVEVTEIDGKTKIKFDGYGGSSSTNLLGRFCHGDKAMKQLVQEIADTETKINTNKIVAEIIHLPESRVGNILMRPNFRTYEIPYLAKSLKPENYQLPIEDLVISVRNNDEIVLRSKTHNKEVIPRLSNAHNFSHNSLPIYHFLCDLQTQNIRSEMWFDYGPLEENHEFLPRVEYGNIILFEATWFIKKERIESLIMNQNQDDKLYESIHLLRSELKIPQFVLLADGDNQLLINFENLTSVRMLLSTINKRTEFELKEFLFSKNSEVKHGEDYFTNQFIVSFYNEKKLIKSSLETHA